MTFLLAGIGLLSDGVSLGDRLLAREPLDLDVAYLNASEQPFVELAVDAGPMALGKTRSGGWGATLQLRPLNAGEDVHLLTFVPEEGGDTFEPALYSQAVMDAEEWRLGISQVPSVTVVLLEADEELAREVRDRVAGRIDYHPSKVPGQVHLTMEGCLMRQPGSRGGMGPAPAPFECSVWEHQLVELLKEQPGLRFAGRTIPTVIPEAATPENG